MAEMEITRNERVLAADGTEIGRVIHVIVDGNTRQVSDLVVERDGNEVMIPIASVGRGTGNTLTMRAPATQAMNGPMFERAAYHEVEEGDVEAMPTRQTAGGATLENVTRDSATIMETGAATMPAATPVRETTRPVPQPTPRTTTQPAQAAQSRVAREGENITVPVVEERLTAGVREREAGRFRLVKTVREEQQSINVPLQQEEAYITERTVAPRPATQADLDAMDRDIEIPLRSQEAVVSKEARVTGEVGIRKEVTTETQRVTDTVHREEVHVEGSNDARIHTEGMTTEQRTRHAAMSPTDQQRYSRFTTEERTRYDAMPERERTAFHADYDRRNPIQKVVDKVEGRG